MILRDYQQRLVDQIRDAYRAGRNAPLVVSPTGSGKTVLFSYIAHNAAARGKRICIGVHRKELLMQASRKLAEGTNGVEHGLIKAGITPRPSLPIQVASVQTLVNRLNKPPFGLPEFKFDLLIIDEAHHATAKTYREILAANPRAMVLGVTATPIRTDGAGLGDIFDDLILGPTVQELIDAGHLAPVDVYAPSMIDVREVHMQLGDYNKKELEVASDKPTITGDAIEHYRRFADRQPAIAFCVSVRHAEHVAAAFAGAGYRARCVEGNTPADERDAAIAALSTGNLDVLTMCDIGNEGLDVPRVVCGIMLRPTKSEVIARQQWGRVLRPAPGKDRAIILDHAGNCLRHGLPTMESEWTLEGKPKAKRGKREQEPPLQVSYCPACYHIFPKAQRCPRCGELLQAPRAVHEVAGELQKVDEEALRKLRRREVQQTRSYPALVELAYNRGYEKPEEWAQHIYESRGGTVIRRGYQEGAA